MPLVALFYPFLKHGIKATRKQGKPYGNARAYHKNPLGLTMKAIREDETTALSVGINAVLYRSIALMVKAIFLALTGGVYSFWKAYVDASTLFNPMLSVKTFFKLTLSLSLPTYGPLLWAFFFEMLFELLWSKFLMLHGLLLGIAIVLLILFFPRGGVWKRS